MSDDYLWDGSGEPDPEIQRLESVLGRFRHDRPAPEFPEQLSFSERLRVWISLPRLAGVAAAALLVVAVMQLIRLGNRVPNSSGQVETKSPAARGTGPAAPKPAWDVARLEGRVKLGPESLSDKGRLALGEWLETDAASRVRIAVGTIGEVLVDPNTRLRLVEAGEKQHRLALARGTIHARIWAPPGNFVVDTPSAKAVDLGCAYTLQVDDKGAGLVRVTSGWVGFQFDGRESFIPTDALCATRPGVGPGTPYFQDASEKLRAALAKLDFEKTSSAERAADLRAVLTAARKRDAITLWHLLSRITDAERSRVYGRLAALVPPPKGVTRKGILHLDKPMLDLWWKQIGLGDTSWWRMWEQPWPPQAK
jgi:FecR-like protein